MEKYLKNCRGNISDLDVIVGQEGKKCRLVAMRANVSQLAAIYRARWAVEIQFRAWKQALNLGKALNRKSNEHHLQALVQAGMIANQLGMKIAQRIVSTVSCERLSYEKLDDPSGRTTHQSS